MSFELIATITAVLILYLSMWWCLRLYYRARRKGYYPAPAATVVLGGAFIAVVAMNALIDSLWHDTAIGPVGLLFVPVPALVVTALVALLPRRPRHAGARRSSFLSSRVPGVMLVVACFAAVVVILPVSVAAGGYVIGLWPQSELGKLGEKLPGGIFLMLGFSMAALAFARERLGAPGLADTVAADTRPAVLYLRAFQQESEPFAWLAPKERSRYTQRTYSPSMARGGADTRRPTTGGVRGGGSDAPVTTARAAPLIASGRAVARVGSRRVGRTPGRPRDLWP